MESVLNPYDSPNAPGSVPVAHNQARGPAIALIVVSIIALVCGILGLLVDFALITTGAAAMIEEQQRNPIPKNTQIAVRSIWGILLLCASTFVLYGAIQMKNQKKYGTARAAAIVAMIPLVGPCCLLGIPFGIWAFVTLEKPEVKDSFRQE
jgi:hypothetical protein